MAINVACEWDMRTTGSDDNGGGYVRGSGTTDYSLQDAAELNLTDVASDGAVQIEDAGGAGATTAVGVIGG